MADVTVKSQADVIDLLIAQHEQIKSLFEATLSGSGNERESSRAAELAEATAPTGPHAGVESQIANFIAGPFAAMLDRARDAISGKP